MATSTNADTISQLLAMGCIITGAAMLGGLPWGLLAGGAVFIVQTRWKHPS